MIAGYYSGTLQEKGPMEEEGLLISLTNQLYFRLNNDKNNP
jgi:hypothetical protein